MVKAVVCRVTKAHVSVDGRVVGRTGLGLLVYVGVMAADTERDVEWLAEKLAGLRVFADAEGKMNRSAVDVAGGLLLIPNFTLAGRTKKGTRPSFTDAAEPGAAAALFERLAEQCRLRIPTETGRFGARMRVACTCEGPVTLILDSLS